MKKIFTIIVPFMVILFVPFAVNAAETRLTASDPDWSDFFGRSVTMGDGVALVGAPGEGGSQPGKAYLYLLDVATGNWDEHKLTPSDADRYDHFGSSVAIDGSTAIIGAQDAEGDIQGNGAAYVFVEDPVNVAVEQARLIAADGELHDKFGHSVAISGDTAIIGAYQDDDHGSSSGSAYIFVRDPATSNWSEQAKLTATDAASDDDFGLSVAISGNTAIVSAKVNVNNGAAYIFERDPATGVWTELKLLASDGAAGDHFGSSVAISGDTIIVGAIGDDDNGSSSGSAYIFERDFATGNWTEQQKLTSLDGVTQDQFGSSVAINGDILIIGASGAGVAGAAYTFVIDPASGDWVQHQKVVPSDQPTDFASAVAIYGDTAIVGAASDTFSGITWAGSAYIFTPVGGPLTEPDITVTDSIAPVDDLALRFGDVTEFTFSEGTITITNDGDADLVIGTIATTLSEGQFTIEVANCAGQTLTPAASCTLTVRFSPQSTGIKAISLAIPSNDPFDNPVEVLLRGVGIGSAVPDITVTDSVAPVDDLAVAFGDVAQGASLEKTLTITNDGTVDLNIGNIAAADVLVAPFSILNDSCSSATVVPATSCTLTVRFDPTSVGAFDDSFDIPSDDSDENPVTFTLTGTGTVLPVPDITVTDSVLPADDQAIAFGDALQGTASDEIVTISNDGTADLVIGDIANVNVLVAPFSILNDNCSGQTVAVAANCTLTVRFAPTAVAVSNDSFDIPTDDPDENPVTVNLSGTGTAILAPEISVNTQVSFGNVTEGTAADKAITISNDGTAALNIGTIANANVLVAPFSIVTDNCSDQTVAAGADCTLTVRFEAGSTGTFNDSFDIPSDDTDEATVTITVNGTSGEAALVTRNSDGFFGLVGAFNPLMLLALLILPVFSRVHRR